MQEQSESVCGISRPKLGSRPATKAQQPRMVPLRSAEPCQACSRRCHLPSLAHSYCPLWPRRTLGRGHVPQCGSGTSGLARASVSPSGSHFCCLCSFQDWEAFTKCSEGRENRKKGREEGEGGEGKEGRKEEDNGGEERKMEGKGKATQGGKGFVPASRHRLRQVQHYYSRTRQSCRGLRNG